MAVPGIEEIRAEFPVLRPTGGRTPPIYLDSACTTLRPEPVINTVAEFQRRSVSCHGRTSHRLGREATEAYEGARAAVARFLGARDAHEVVFVRNATEGINLVASCGPLSAGDAVLTSGIEHNSNRLPWQRLGSSRGIRHRVHRVRLDRPFDLDAFERDLTEDVRLVALPLVSNLCGVTLPIERIARRVHARGALLLVDAAQAPTTHDLDVGRLGADFLTISFHKMFGPAAIGALWARRELLAAMPPFLAGGGTVDDVTADGVVWSPLPDRFDAGVANVEGAVGARAAIDYLTRVGGPARIRRHVEELNTLATEGLRGHRRLHLIGPPDPASRGSIFAFFVDGLESEALARLLDTRESIMVRHGKLCVHAWFHDEGVPDSVRASFSIYNTADEVRRFVRIVENALALLE
jgi:cysteine desulfurase / selenocysteine lyase